MFLVSTRQPHSHRLQKARAEKSDKQFQDSVFLPTKLRHGTSVDPQIMDDCQHMDQSATERIVSGVMLPKGNPPRFNGARP